MALAFDGFAKPIVMLVGCDNRTGIPGAANEFFPFRGWLLLCLHRYRCIVMSYYRTIQSNA